MRTVTAHENGVERNNPAFPLTRLTQLPDRYFGASCEVWTDIDNLEQQTTAAAGVLTLWEQADRELSRFRPDSDISRINTGTGTWVSTTSRVCDLVRSALDARHRSDGLFDPTVSAAAAGYNRDYRTLLTAGAFTSPVPTRTCGAAVDIDMERCAIRTEPGAHIDLGAIAKGAIADATYRWLTSNGTHDAIVNIGGDIAFNNTWSFDIEDVDINMTRHRWARWAVHGGGIATSGTRYRTWVDPATNEQRHHIIDPRTGQMPETPYVCVSAYAADAATAEIAATVALVSGDLDKAALFGAVAVAVDADNTLYGFDTAQAWCTPADRSHYRADLA